MATLLIINEPTTGLTDQTARLHIGEGPGGLGGTSSTRFSNMLKQRGTAEIALGMEAGDNYQPTIGSPIYLYDVDVAGNQWPVFAGTIDAIQTSWWGTAGYRLASVSCVSFEQSFDVVRVPPMLFNNETADQIFKIVFGLVGTPPAWEAGNYLPGMRILESGHTQICTIGGASGSTAPSWNNSGGTTTDGAVTWQDLGVLNMAPVGLGNPGTSPPGVSSAPTISQFYIHDFPTVADVFDQLATLSQFVWGVNLGTTPGTQTVYFSSPATIPVPAVWSNAQVNESDVQWEQIDIKGERHDYRNRQYIKMATDTLGRSAELFAGTGQSSFALLRPCSEVTNAWITKNTQNHATGTFSGQPTAGDTITITYPSSGSIYNWAANSQYAVGQIIVDSGGHIQRVTTSTAIGHTYGLSGATVPSSWNHAGGYTTDNQLRWLDQGAANFGPYLNGVYTFVSALDNTVWGQVLIGSSVAATVQNLADAINCNAATQGITFSLPTWENPLINALGVTGTTFGAWNKYAGQGFIASLSRTGTAFTWSASATSGGVTTGGTNSISVGNANAQVQGLSFTPGSNLVTLFSPLNTGTSLAVEYHRTDSDLAVVEDTPLVNSVAATEHGTGKYQAYTSSSNLSQGGGGQGLYEAQQALTAFSTIPSTLEFITYRPGLLANQGLIINFSFPFGPSIQSQPGGSGNIGWVYGGRLIVPAVDGVVRSYFANFEDQAYLGDASFGNGTVQVTFDGIGGATMTYLGAPHFTLYSNGFGVNGNVYVHAGPGGATSGTGYIGGPVPIASGDIPSPGYEMKVECFSTTYTWFTGPGSNNSDGLVHAYLQGGIPGWVIQEISGELIHTSSPLKSSSAPSGYGFFRYTVRCINTAQIGSWLDFWEALGGGSSGGISSTGTSTPAPEQNAAGAGVVAVQLNGTLIGTEPTINLIPGVDITMSVVDDPTNSSVDVTVNSALKVTHNSAVIGTEPILEFEDGANVTLTLTDDPPNSRVKVLVSASVTGIITDIIHSYTAPPAAGTWNWIAGSQSAGPGVSASLGSNLDLFAPTDNVSAKYLRMVYQSLTSSPYTIIAAIEGFILDASSSSFGIFTGGVSSVSATWASSHAYTLGSQIVDTNNNIQQVTTAGTSGSGSHPVWNGTIGGPTADGGTLVWTNEGPAVAFISVGNQINRWVVAYQNNYQNTKSAPVTVGSNITPQTVWFKIQDDGSNISISISQFNTDWVSIYKAARTVFLLSTANAAGFFVQAGASYDATATLSSWLVSYP